jgi:putative redox protein
MKYNDIEVSFPGGKRVDAQVGSFVVQTDQPAELGGEGTAVAPYELFLASLATCAGIYALGFCQSRGLSTEGLALRQSHTMDPETHLLTHVGLELTLPADFPEKYHAAVLRALGSCKVKRTLDKAITFTVGLSAQAPAAG